MSTPQSNPDEPPTDSEFNQALADLIQTALTDGVDVEGGWRVPGETNEYDFGIEIYRVESKDD